MINIMETTQTFSKTESIKSPAKKPIIAGDSTFIMNDALMVSLIVSLSLFVALTISTVVGTIIPIVLKKVHIDPAVASGPFITTVNDIVAIVIYYSLASFLFTVL